MKKKLIEVALPLEAINKASAREKSIRHGHPSTLHLWWARRPLAAARAVIFAQMVEDPSGYVDVLRQDPKLRRKAEATLKERKKLWADARALADKAKGSGVSVPEPGPEPTLDEILADQERQRLFRIIEDLVLWENTTNETVLQAARDEIWQSWRYTCAENADHPRAEELFNRKKLPAFHDPFAGGGALPLEAQRLGLEAYASDLNPVAVLINKAMIEIPPKFAGKPPVNPESLLGAQASRLLFHDDAWRSRNYLPHFDRPGLVQTITFRLADCLPHSVLEHLSQELAHLSDAGRQTQREKRVAQWLDQGHGACRLRDPRIAELVENTLLHFDGQRYCLLAWCVMPNHVHAMIETVPGHGLDQVLHSWKSFTAKEANRLLRRTGTFWQIEYHDRFIRDNTHFASAKRYIEENPVKAGLVGSAEEWRWGSAWKERQAGGTPALPAWRGARGLAEDVRYYGKWMRDEAEKRIGHLYPKIEITAEMVAGSAGVSPARPDLKPYIGQKLTVIAWLWARTVKSPNPAFAQVDVPLASTFMLCTKPGREAYVEPVILGARAPGPPDAAGTAAVPGVPAYRFTVKVGKPKDAEAAKRGTKLSRGANFECLMSETPIASDHIYGEAQAGRMGARLMAIVAEGDRGRVYLAPTPEHEAAALKAKPEWKPDVAMPENPRWFSPPLYGLTTYGDLFTPRQLVALTTFSDLVQEARERVKRDALGARASGPLNETFAHPSAPSAHPGWHSRGYHPHFDAAATVQSITFRLHDSVPAELIDRWRNEIAMDDTTDPERQASLRERIARFEDSGYGESWLRDARFAEIVVRALLHFDAERYRLLEWCVMPNHVHVLVETFDGHQLSEVVRSWKTFTAREANRLLAREGPFWMADYFDRYVRDERHFRAVREYIRQNPVKAGLCATAEEWPWSSAGGERAGGPRTQDDDSKPLAAGGTGATAYADAVAVYLGFGIDKMSDRHSTLSRWDPTPTASGIINTFSRQALPMTWDYAEGNPFSEASGNFEGGVGWIAKVIDMSLPALAAGAASQADASIQNLSAQKLISADPPYYDNIGYADLSDFFYVWLRRSLKPIFPDLFATFAVPKAEELVATPYRHGSKEKAETFFLGGMTQAMHRFAEQAHLAFPVTIYYAFKQSESLGTRASGPHAAETAAVPGTASTGWDTFLAAVIEAGFAITGTWPMRTELGNRMIGSGTNALASSIILVCRPRVAEAPTVTRREFVSALKAELPQALAHLQRGNIAPVDLAQAAIGPGMAVYTRYGKVLDAEGNPLKVREALALINQTLDEALAEQEGDFDADSRWALVWFEQSGFAEGEYGFAEQLSKSKNTSVAGMVEAGILESKRGKVRLLRPEELPADWDPVKDPRLTAWEIVHHLIRVLATGGEGAAAELVGKLGAKAEIARELAYRLYTLCERKKRAAEALSYNSLVQSWPEIIRLGREGIGTKSKQTPLFQEEHK